MCKVRVLAFVVWVASCFGTTCVLRFFFVVFGFGFVFVLLLPWPSFRGLVGRCIDRHHRRRRLAFLFCFVRRGRAFS